MDVHQIKLESSKDNLLQTIIENKENLDTQMVANAIKEFVKNHESYKDFKKKHLDEISND